MKTTTMAGWGALLLLVASTTGACSDDASSGGAAATAGGSGASGSAGSSGTSGSGGNAGASDAGGSGGDGGCLAYAAATPTDACTDWATGWCALQDRCHGNNSLGTGATCVSRGTAHCVAYLGETQVATPAGVAALAAKLDGAKCVDFVYQELFFWNVPTGEGCGTPEPLLPHGAACVDSSQCEGGRCDQSAGICGTCAALLGLGETCQWDEECAAELYCTSSGSPGGSCAARIGLGQPCSALEDCVEGASCASDQICRELGSAGAACSSSSDCVDAHTCGVDDTCTPYALAELGEPCVPGNFATCAPAFECDPGTSKCVANPLPAVGEACDPVEGCAGDARCVQGTCKPPIQDGEPCSFHPECLWPSWCVDGICQEPTGPQC